MSTKKKIKKMVRAAGAGNIVKVNKYLNYPCVDVNDKDEYGDTALINACRKGRINIVKLLLDHGANIEEKMDDGTALSNACYYNHFTTAKLLVDKGANIHEKDNRGATPLHDACIAANVRLVKLLLERGADPNIKDNDDCAPLFKASYYLNKHLFCVQELIRHGAIMDVKNAEGQTPLGLAYQEIETLQLELFHNVEKNEVGIYKIVLNPTNNKQSRMIKAASEGDIEQVRRFLSNSCVDANRKDEYGDTALIQASSAGHDYIVKLLLDHGANIEEKMNDGTALSNACYYNHFTTAKLLVDKGANIHEKDSRGATPLHNACENGNVRLVKLLLERGADPNIKDNDDCAPLFKASYYLNKHLFCVQELIRHGAIMDVKNAEEKTPYELSFYNVVDKSPEESNNVEQQDCSQRRKYNPLHEQKPIPARFESQVKVQCSNDLVILKEKVGSRVQAVELRCEILEQRENMFNQDDCLKKQKRMASKISRSNTKRMKLANDELTNKYKALSIELELLKAKQEQLKNDVDARIRYTIMDACKNKNKKVTAFVVLGAYFLGRIASKAG